MNKPTVVTCILYWLTSSVLETHGVQDGMPCRRLEVIYVNNEQMKIWQYWYKTTLDRNERKSVTIDDPMAAGLDDVREKLFRAGERQFRIRYAGAPVYLTRYTLEQSEDFIRERQYLQADLYRPQFITGVIIQGGYSIEVNRGYYPYRESWVQKLAISFSVNGTFEYVRHQTGPWAGQIKIFKGNHDAYKKVTLKVPLIYARYVKLHPLRAVAGGKISPFLQIRLGLVGCIREPANVEYKNSQPDSYPHYARIKSGFDQLSSEQYRMIWTIQGSKNMIIKYSIREISLKSRDICGSQIQIFDGTQDDGVLLQKLCSGQIQAENKENQHSTKNEIAIVFDSMNGEDYLYLKFLQKPAINGGCGRQAFLKKRKKRVIGGTTASSGRWPWAVEVMRNKLGHYCGGTLIHSKWVLTAAHCVYNKSQSDLFILTRSMQKIPVSHVILHDTFHKLDVPFQLVHDLALLYLKSPAELSYYTNIVCRPNEDMDLQNKPNDNECFFAGWGQTFAGSYWPRPEELQELRINIIQMHICKRYWLPHAYWMSSDMMCVGRQINYAGHMCPGDSGGGISCARNNVWSIEGVFSWLYRPCGTAWKPSVLNRVQPFWTWIKSVLHNYYKET